jgi:prepilin-type N-terminal cleavage/methylation domain-containing protein
MTGRRGVTLIELMVVVVLIALIVGITFPSVASGLDSIRLASATDAVASFLSSALNRAERRQQVIEVTVDRRGNLVLMRAMQSAFFRRLEMPDGILIAGVLPPLPGNPDIPRRFFLYPGGSVPGFGIQLVTRKGVQRVVRVDPVTGVPMIERVPTGGGQ